MTRINVVSPSSLSRLHLIAEYRELPRIFALSYAAQKRGENPATYSATYTLGKGHVKFFYPKLGWITKRFDALVTEMLARGYNPTYRYPQKYDHDLNWLQDWQPTDEALAINMARIKERTK